MKEFVILEDFVQANVNDKLDLEELAEKTKKRLKISKLEMKKKEEN